MAGLVMQANGSVVRTTLTSSRRTSIFFNLPNLDSFLWLHPPNYRDTLEALKVSIREMRRDGHSNDASFPSPEPRKYHLFMHPQLLKMVLPGVATERTDTIVEMDTQLSQGRKLL